MVGQAGCTYTTVMMDEQGSKAIASRHTSRPKVDSTETTSGVVASISTFLRIGHWGAISRMDVHSCSSCRTAADAEVSIGTLRCRLS